MTPLDDPEPARAASARIVVLAIGNVLLRDEGLGIRALERFGERYQVPPQVQLVDGGTSAMDLMDVVAGCDRLVVVDAVVAGREPGTLVRLAGSEVPVFFRCKLSPHQVGLPDLLAALEFSGELPRSTVVLGIEPLDLSLGEELSRPVLAGLPELVQGLVAELREAGCEPCERADLRLS